MAASNGISADVLPFDIFSAGIGFALGALIFGVFLLLALLKSSKSETLLTTKEEEINKLQTALQDKEDDYLSLVEASSATKEQKKALEAAKEQMTNQFKTLSQEALSVSNESFMKLAQERFKQWEGNQKGELEKRTLSIDEMVKPVKKQLEALTASLEQVKGTDTALKEELKNLQSETSKIAGAMHNPASRGKWGEYVLERLLENSGLIKDVHFRLQETISGHSERVLRPDVIIHLQDGLKIVVDSKAPIQDVLDDLSDQTKEKELAARLATQVRKHITDLGKKSYQDSLDSPDFVVLFLPAEHLFSLAVSADPGLIDYAAEKNIVLASPILIMSILRVVRMSWQQNELAENAKDIAKAGAEMHKRLNTFTGHFSKLGKSIQGSIDHYNKAIGSFERSVMPQARRFEELHAAGGKELPELSLIDTVPQNLTITSHEAEDDSDEKSGT